MYFTRKGFLQENCEIMKATWFLFEQ